MVKVDGKEDMVIVHCDNVVDKIFTRTIRGAHSFIWDDHNDITITKKENSMLIKVNNESSFELNHSILKFTLAS